MTNTTLAPDRVCVNPNFAENPQSGAGQSPSPAKPKYAPPGFCSIRLWVYPRAMPSNPPGSPGGSRSQPSPVERRDERGRSLGQAIGERYGPVAIERLTKEDGRSLILYSQIDNRSHA